MDNNDNDRIRRDAEEIARAAVDIETQRSIETGAEAKEHDIDAQIAKLQHERASMEAERSAAHDREVADEKLIADRDRDLRDALGGAAGGPGGGAPSGPGGGAGGSGGSGGGPTSGSGPAPGPGGPPVVPPRRVG